MAVMLWTWSMAASIIVLASIVLMDFLTGPTMALKLYVAEYLYGAV